MEARKTLETAKPGKGTERWSRVPKRCDGHLELERERGRAREKEEREQDRRRRKSKI